MKILICDQLNEIVLNELKTLGECIDVSMSDSKGDEINENIVDSEIVVIRSGTVLNKEILELGKNIKIKGGNNTKENIYVNDVRYNDIKYSKNWLDHNELIKGGNIEFKMSNQPNYNCGSGEKDIPYSMSKK